MAGIQAGGGIITAEDLTNYTAEVRTPLRGTYRGYDIVAMPLPSSGGVGLVETLNILEGFPLAEMKQGSAASLHVLIEAMKRAYADRAHYLGDPAFVSAPVATLTTKDYAAKHGLVYLDYYSAMADEKGAMKLEFTDDGVHPNAAGYAIMGKLAEKAISAALARE